MIRPSFKMTTAASTLVARFDGVRRDLTGTMEKVSKAHAEECAKLVTTNVKKQFYPMIALSPKYLLRKTREGKDTRILIATGKYIKGIKAAKSVDGVWGVRADMRVGKWLENGTRKMRARPHWAPTYALMRRNTPKAAIKALRDALLGE